MSSNTNNYKKKKENVQQNEKHTKVFHECQRKDDGNTNYDDQVVSIQEPLSKRQPKEQMSKKNQCVPKQK